MYVGNLPQGIGLQPKVLQEFFNTALVSAGLVSACFVSEPKAVLNLCTGRGRGCSHQRCLDIQRRSLRLPRDAQPTRSHQRNEARWNFLVTPRASHLPPLTMHHRLPRSHPSLSRLEVWSSPQGFTAPRLRSSHRRTGTSRSARRAHRPGSRRSIRGPSSGC